MGGRSSFVNSNEKMLCSDGCWPPKKHEKNENIHQLNVSFMFILFLRESKDMKMGFKKVYRAKLHPRAKFW